MTDPNDWKSTTARQLMVIKLEKNLRTLGVQSTDISQLTETENKIFRSSDSKETYHENFAKLISHLTNKATVQKQFLLEQQGQTMGQHINQTQIHQSTSVIAQQKNTSAGQPNATQIETQSKSAKSPCLLKHSDRIAKQRSRSTIMRNREKREQLLTTNAKLEQLKLFYEIKKLEKEMDISHDQTVENAVKLDIDIPKVK